MNLVKALDDIGIEQLVYHPMRDESKIGNNIVHFSSARSSIIYRPILNKYQDRVLYRKKIKKIFSDIQNQIDFSQVKIIHAHTWYSDGGVAYLLSKKFGIPYVIAVRSTDVSFFFRFLFWERGFGLKVLKNAKRIIFISKSHSLSIVDRLPVELKCKSEIIPNGVDDFWLNNFKTRQPKRLQTFNVLYVGQFIKRKNIDKLYKAVKALREQGIDVKLHLVGDFQQYLKKDLISTQDYVKCYGIITSKEELLDVYNVCDIFAMPSINETFGLVYIEALTQGLPILYTKRDGIDGFYDSVGEGVEKPITVEQVKLGLERMMQSFSTYIMPHEKLEKNHRWSRIAERYKKIYLSFK
jgi:glycosyltransferase involved in cell wall biosynthesis